MRQQRELLTTKNQNFMPQVDSKSRHAITINRKPDEVYSFVRNFENLLRILKGFVDIKMISETVSQWKVQSKTGFDLSWAAEVTEEIPNEKISWTSPQSFTSSEVKIKGSVWFIKAPVNLGTIVSLSMDYDIIGGKASEWIAFFGGEDPDTLAKTNLKRLKSYLETGEIATTEGQPSGREEISLAETTH